MVVETEHNFFTGYVKETLSVYGLSSVIAFVVASQLQVFVNCNFVCSGFGVLLLTPIFTTCIRKYRARKRITPSGKAVFITGCDTGFGHMLAQRLDDVGFQVFAGCLFPDGDGATKLRTSGSIRLNVIGLDVTSDSSVQEAAAYVTENLKTNVLWAVVNNAGVIDVAEIHWANIHVIKRVFEVNAIGIIRTTQAFLSKLKESKGRVITVASAGGRFAVPSIIPYTMTKHAAVAFSEGLSVELRKWGVHVISVEPYMYRTPMGRESELLKQMNMTWNSAPKSVKDVYGPDYIEKYMKGVLDFEKRFINSNPSEVVAAMEQSVTALQPENVYTPGSMTSSCLARIARLLPKSLTDIVTIYIMSHYMSLKR